MLNFFKSQHCSILGIDVSPTAVKILELSKNGDQYSVEGYGRASLPDHAMESHVIKDIDLVADCIKKLLIDAGLSCRFAACAVPESSVISKIIQINEGLTEQEVEELVTIEADKCIPYPIDEINVDFNVIGPSSKNSAMVDVLIVASRTENVSNRAELILRAGLVAKVVDVDSYAMARASQLLKTDLPAGGHKKIIAIIDIGVAYTHLIILHDMKIIFSREELFGGMQLIDAVAAHYGISNQEAITAIEEGTLQGDYANKVLYPFIELFFLQVKRALQFFFSTSQHTDVDHIILAGGTARLPKIARLLEGHMGVPTSIANPFVHMKFAKKVNYDAIISDAPMLMVACGLALRQLE